MARPQHQTVEYFSHDTDASEGRTLTIIQGEFGLIGYALWWKLLEWLGKTDGHFFDARNSDDLEFLLRKFGCDVVSGTGILQKLAKLGAIDPVLWEHRIIWSQKFVDRLTGVYKKRDRDLPQKPCFCNENCNHSDLTDVITGTETAVLGSGIPQSKVKESKVNNTPIIPSLTTEKIESLKKDGAEQSPELTAVVQAFQMNGGIVASQQVALELADITGEYGAEIVIAGFRKAALAGKSGIRLLRYCRPIWEDFKANGIKEEHGAHQKSSNLSRKYTSRKYTDPDEWLRKQREIAAGDEPTSEPGE